MRTRLWTRYGLLGFSTAVALGLGCGGNGLGCGGGSSLPKEPGPWGFPMDQAVEGGMQARITKPGFDKLSSMIPTLAAGALPTQQKPQCLGVQSANLTIAGTGAQLHMCNGACGGGTGCAVWVDLRKDLAPPGGIGISMADGINPVVNIDAAFDVHMRAPIEHRFCIFGICQGWQNDCTMQVNSPGTHVKAGIQLGIDPTTGKLTIALGNVDLLGLDLKISDCGLLSEILNVVAQIVNAVAKSFIGDTIIGLLKPQLSNLIRGFLPDPPGLASRMDLAATLASYGAPPEAALEILGIAGGYVSARSGGLNLGVITGANSDRDPKTRLPGPDAINSEPSLCVPRRPTYDLGRSPWNLQRQAQRGSYILDVAPEFAGMPDPMDAGGAVQDIALGVSRTFLDMAGFHLFNSGTLCLSIGESVLGTQLNIGTLSVLMKSLGNIIDNRRAPVALTLRPEQPLVFTLGAGTAGDPLLKVAATDLRIDFYGMLEERFVRLFTMAVDLNVGVDLSVTMGMDGKPMLAPMISGIDSKNVTIRVTNTDLLQEDPKKLGKTLLSLIDIAVGQLAGGIKPIALPSLMGFTLDGLQVKRVQTKQDDFLAILGALKQDPNAMPYPIPEDIVGLARPGASIDTHAQVVHIDTPPPEVIRAAVQDGRRGDGDTPSVTLRLGGTGRDMEWSYRIDGGGWRPWSSDAHPTLFDAAFLLQARHAIDVRAREKGDWTTEDQTPAHLEVVIDSLAPALTLDVEKKTRSIAFHGEDNVSEPGALLYAWKTPSGWTRADRRDYLTFDEAWEATAKGTALLEVAAFDELGNQSVSKLSLADLNEFHGRMQSPGGGGGCGCKVAGRPSDGGSTAAWLVMGLLAALLGRRRVRRSTRLPSSEARLA